jgi:hypothetical protein
MTYSRWMAAACTMTVMRRGLWKRGQRGEVHIKVSKAYAWTAPFSCITTPPSPGFFSLPDELNYLLSLLTPDDCSFPLAHIIYTIRVMFREMSTKSLVSQSSISTGVHGTTSLFCCQVRTLITFLSRLEKMRCRIVSAVRQQSEKSNLSNYFNAWALCPAFIHTINFLLALTFSMISRFQFRPWPMDISCTWWPSDWTRKYSLVSAIQKS